MPSFQAPSLATAYRRSVALALAWAAALVLPSIARGQEPAADPEPAPPPSEARQMAELYVDAFIAQATSEAKGDESVVPSEHKESPSTVALASRMGKVDSALGRALAGMLEKNVQPIVDGLGKLTPELDQQLAELRTNWIDVRTAISERQALLDNAIESRQMAARTAALWSVDRTDFWLLGLLGVAALVLVVIHGRRHAWRRRLSRSLARTIHLPVVLLVAVLLLLAAAAVTLSMADHVYEAWWPTEIEKPEPPEDGLRAENEKPAADSPANEGTKENPATGSVAPQPQNVATTPNWPDKSKLSDQSSTFHTQSRHFAQQLKVLESVATAMQTDLIALATINEQLEADTDATIGYHRLRDAIRAAVGLGLLGLAIGGGWLFRRATLRQEEAEARRCPACLGSGGLRAVKAPEQQDQAEQPPTPTVRCRAPLGQNAQQRCGYSFPREFRRTTKLCFSLLGLPRSGKTHWLAMLHRELARGGYAELLDLEAIASSRAEDYDRIARRIIDRRIGPAATPNQRPPQPLVFRVHDDDRWGRSELLANLFDFSGKVVANATEDDYRRRRAVDGDGWLLFLDPTRPGDEQGEAIAALGSQLRQVKAQSPHRRPTPIAVCVSKIDLLAAQHYALPDGADAVAKFYADLAEIDPTGQSLSTRVVEARSRLVAELCETIWPGWPIEQQLAAISPGRTLFFPLTPVGLDGRGEADLALRTLAPFGLVEPLLWLLQMNGYPVLS